MCVCVCVFVSRHLTDWTKAVTSQFLLECVGGQLSGGSTKFKRRTMPLQHKGCIHMYIRDSGSVDRRTHIRTRKSLKKNRAKDTSAKKSEHFDFHFFLPFSQTFSAPVAKFAENLPTFASLKVHHGTTYEGMGRTDVCWRYMCKHVGMWNSRTYQYFLYEHNKICRNFALKEPSKET